MLILLLYYCSITVLNPHKKKSSCEYLPSEQFWENSALFAAGSRDRPDVLFDNNRWSVKVSMFGCLIGNGNDDNDIELVKTTMSNEFWLSSLE